MRRKGFLLNSAVLVLLIPLLLLLATYEDVSSSIIRAQSERTQMERTYDVINFLNLEFQRALELSGKRAVVTAVDYVAVTGNFISPAYGANNTIRDLIKSGTSPTTAGYDTVRVMGGQTIRNWLSNVSKLLQDQGYTLSPSVDEIVDSMDITVAPLDAFTVVIKARIPHVTISDSSGIVVYDGPIPSYGGYVYSTVDIRELEDPMFSAITGGRYQRSIRACPYAYPELGLRPFTVANGTGIGTDATVLGYFGTDFQYNLTDIWDSSGNHISNLSIGGIPVTTREVILNNGDVGVLKFYNTSSSEGEAGLSRGWCSSLGYRINLTIQNNVGIDLNDYQIPLLISTAKGFTTQILDFIFQNTENTYSGDKYRTNASIAFYDANCNPVPFWIEYWDPTTETALVWLRLSIPKDGRVTVEMYFGNEVPPTKGDGDSVFIFFDDFDRNTLGTKWVVVDQIPTISDGELYVKGGNSIEAIRTKYEINYDGSFAIRFRMRASSSDIGLDWDSGIGFQDSSPDLYWLMYFTDDVLDVSNTLAIHEGGWWSRYTSAQQRRAGNPTSYHLYEAYLVDTGVWYDWNTKRYDATFKDITDGRVNYDTKYKHKRLLDPPALKYLYVVNDNDGSGDEGIYDFIFVRKYPERNGETLQDPNFNGITLYWRTTTLSEVVENKPTSGTSTTASSPGDAAVYDLQPFIDCLLDQRYFGIYDGWSFFERLEGSNKNHIRYEALANSTQDELGMSYEGKHYPIGLVSFMIPYADYDAKLANLMTVLGLPTTNVSSADYYFLDYYFGSRNKVDGYQVWGISHGVYSGGDLSRIPFYLDDDTARAIFGEQGTCDLLYGYNCS